MHTVLCIMLLTLTDGEGLVQLSKCVNLSVFVILSLILSIFRLSLCVLVTDGHCKQLCFTGLVTWFLLE